VLSIGLRDTRQMHVRAAAARSDGSARRAAGGTGARNERHATHTSDPSPWVRMTGYSRAPSAEGGGAPRCTSTPDGIEHSASCGGHGGVGAGGGAGGGGLTPGSSGAIPHTHGV
jgi:hypothetical protein